MCDENLATTFLATFKYTIQYCYYSPYALYLHHACKLSCFSHVWLFVMPWIVACQAPLSMGFSREEHWSGLSCPPPEDLPHTGIKSAYPAAPGLQADSLPLSHWGSIFTSLGVIYLITGSWSPSPISPTLYPCLWQSLDNSCLQKGENSTKSLYDVLKTKRKFSGDSYIGDINWYSKKFLQIYLLQLPKQISCAYSQNQRVWRG